ncbi:MAG: cysteine synthase [Desulfobacterales bacterium]|nr:cysteine synthase [Desulfobacterales bacterium]
MTNDSVLDAIGNTPLVEIRRMNPNPRVKLLAKLEYVNPGGSIKDRPALYMIEAAERAGELTPEKIVVEATSGNTGIGLAMVCAVKGYRLLLAMSESVSVERQRILKARGAEILLTPGHLGTDGAIEEVYRLVRENPGRYFAVDQFNNPANWQAHYHGTAEEIWRQTGGAVGVLVAPMGTTGTLMGVSRRLKEYNPAVRIIGVEPYLGHRIQGLKNLKEAYCPEIFEKQRLDEKVNIEDEEAYETARRLAREEGLLVGMSSGAAMAAAVNAAGRMADGILVVILPDGGERYLSTPLFAVQEAVDLCLYNLLGRTREKWEPLKAGRTTVYTCGPRLQRPLQLAEARRFVLADLLCRYLRWRGLAVKQAIDIMDLEEAGGAAGEEVLPETESRQRLDAFLQDLSLLRIRPPDHLPRSRDHVADMTALGRKLADKGLAYEKLRSLYFDLSRVSGYGRLSGVDTAKVRVGATVDLDDYEKQNPRDFALFRRCRLSELKRGAFVRSEWGNVRPSWHVQTTAMAVKHLGDCFDLHVSSRELVFPHHENENAIAQALFGRPLANGWVHAERVTGEAPALAELTAQGFSGRELRTWLLSVHYRKPLAYSAGRLEDARRSLQRLDRCVQSLLRIRNGRPAPDLDQLMYDLRQGVRRAFDDDLNLPGALAALFLGVKRINAWVADGRMDAQGAGRLLALLRDLDAVLAIFDFNEAGEASAEIHRLIEARRRARAERDWAQADRIRDELLGRGIRVQDTKI